ncbi:MAG: glycosyl transferase, partial [Pseudomonadota bacterium]|nr:glycosyl transferase [Pseudomonadota bacterium]
MPNTDTPHAGLDPVTVACIKWGEKFPAYYVNRLYAGVKRFMDRPFRFVCFTEDASGIRPEVEVFPLPDVPFEDEMVVAMTTGRRRGAWRKVTMLKQGVGKLSGPCLGLDLDVVITGPLGVFFDYKPGKLCMGRDWLERRRGRVGGHGSAFRFDPDLHSYLYEEFAADVEGSIAWKGEQRYTSMTAKQHGDLEYFPDGWVCSFKRQAIAMFPFNYFVEPRLPVTCKIMCFHGSPKMEDALV